MNAEAVVHVDGVGAGDDEYATLTAALAANAGAPELTIILHANAGNIPYQESVVISAGYVAILAAAGEEPRVQGNNAPGFTVAGTLYMEGVRVSQSTGVGLSIQGGEAWVRRSKLANNNGGGIVVDGGGMLMLENSFVGSGNINSQRIINVLDGQISVQYSTVGAGFGGTSRAIGCAVGAGAGSVVRNSIVVSYSAENEIDCPNIEIVDGLIESESDEIFTELSGWFVGFDEGNFHLSGTHPSEIETAATWQTGDPATDIAGLPRPTIDGTPDFAGAALIP